MNIIALSGNVVKDPNSRSTPSGKSVSTLRIAVNNPLNDDEVLFIDVESWDKQSEFVNKYVKKGSAVEVTGRLKLDEWVKDGTKQSKYVVAAERIHFIGSKKKDNPNAPYQNDEQSSAEDDAKFAEKLGIRV
jgi:single-strand DNA-binding protein